MQYILLLISYLIGSIPFSIVLGKLVKGVDIRDYGSGNPGTTNAMRVLGRKWGTTVFIFDVVKGGFIIFLIQLGLFDQFDLFHPLLYGLAAVIGHIVPVFLKFKGGKAVASGVGVFLFYAPLLGVIGLLGFLIGVKLTRYISVGSTLGTFSLLITVIIVYFAGPSEDSALRFLFGERGDILILIIGLIANILIFYRHRKNFVRIKNKTEPQTTWLNKKKESAE